MADDEAKVYALNLFDIADREEYLAYSRRSAREVARHGGRVVALGQFRESVTGDIAPRQVLFRERRYQAFGDIFLGHQIDIQMQRLYGRAQTCAARANDQNVMFVRFVFRA